MFVEHTYISLSAERFHLCVRSCSGTTRHNTVSQDVPRLFAVRAIRSPISPGRMDWRDFFPSAHGPAEDDVGQTTTPEVMETATLVECDTTCSDRG